MTLDDVKPEEDKTQYPPEKTKKNKKLERKEEKRMKKAKFQVVEQTKEPVVQ